MFEGLPESGSEGSFGLGFMLGVLFSVIAFVVGAFIGSAMTVDGTIEAVFRNAGMGAAFAQIVWAVPLFLRYRKRGEHLTGYGLLVPAGTMFLLATLCSAAG